MAISNTTFIHFNDIYNADKAAPFVSSIKNCRRDLLSSSEEEVDGHRRRDVFTFFSGDVFSPSILSTFFRGEQMLPVLNALDIDCACLGNHELDFGLAHFSTLSEKCNFPWICSNAVDSIKNKPLGGCKEYHIIDKTNTGGPKLLIIGLIEQRWLDTLSAVDPGNIIFEAPSDFVKRRVPELRDEFGPFDALVAVTHMTMPNDKALAENGGVDIILGGHDHHYEDVIVNGIRVLNSGSNFNCYTVVNIDGRNSIGQLETSSRRIDITPDDIPDKAVADAVKVFQDRMNEGRDLDKVIGWTRVDLDARFTSVRTKETNTSNLIAELMTRSTGADIAILNSGTIRADRIIKKGNITMKDLCELLPIDDENKVISITGKDVLLALENGVSQVEAMEGRFPCVDGIRFEFDPRKEPFSRINADSVYVRDCPYKQKGRSKIRGEDMSRRQSRRLSALNSLRELIIEVEEEESILPGYSRLDLNMYYSVVSNVYLTSGKEGYDIAFEGAKVLQDADECPRLPVILRNFFIELRVLRQWQSFGKVERHVSAVELAVARFKGLINKDNDKQERVRLRMEEVIKEDRLYSICPHVEGRIKNLELEDMKDCICE